MPVQLSEPPLHSCPIFASSPQHSLAHSFDLYTPSYSLIASLRLSERKVEWCERSAGHESTPGPLDRDAHVPYCYRTVNHPPSGQDFIMSALALVDIWFSTSSIASRLACVFIRALSQSFIRRHSSYPMMNVEKQQGISSA